MKTKVKLTAEQVDKLVATDEKQLHAKFERDLASLRKKYEFVEVEIGNDREAEKQTKAKMTDDFFIQLWNEGKKNSEIALEAGYNPGYISLVKKRLIEKGLIKDRK